MKFIFHSVQLDFTLMNKILSLAFIAFFLFNCNTLRQKKQADNSTAMENKISPTPSEVQNYVAQNMVFAHRGSTYWTPEETESSLRWARNIGADYLEFDLQKTKDGHLVVLHDNTLARTSNVSEVFPERANAVTIDFTLKELRQLDIGTWFNTANPDRAREKFIGQRILTFKDAIMIAEGYWLKKDINGQPLKEMKDGEWTGFYTYEKDPNDNKNRPGIYAETKVGGLEELLARELIEMGWNINNRPKKIKTKSEKIGIGNTNARFVLQSFSPESIEKLEVLMPNIPKCLLIWEPAMTPNLKANYQKAIDFALENNVHFIGPSISGAPNNYNELAAPWMTEMVHNAGLKIHAYTFDTKEQIQEYSERVDGFFTNKADLALKLLGRESEQSAEEVLDELGY